LSSGSFGLKVVYNTLIRAGYGVDKEMDEPGGKDVQDVEMLHLMD